MDKYAEIILRILEDHHIKGMYDSESEIIYICREEESGSVYNLFGCNKDQLESRLICPTMSVQKGQTDKMQECLSNINQQLDLGGFYIDSISGCIAYAIDYTVPSSGIRYGDTDLERFCTKAWKIYSNYRASLCWIVKQLENVGE